MNAVRAPLSGGRMSISGPFSPLAAEESPENSQEGTEKQRKDQKRQGPEHLRSFLPSCLPVNFPPPTGGCRFVGMRQRAAGRGSGRGSAPWSRPESPLERTCPFVQIPVRFSPARSQGLAVGAQADAVGRRGGKGHLVDVRTVAAGVVDRAEVAGATNAGRPGVALPRRPLDACGAAAVERRPLPVRGGARGDGPASGSDDAPSPRCALRNPQKIHRKGRRSRERTRKRRTQNT